MTLCGDITITGDIADKCPEYTGVFHDTGRMMYGKPVFINDQGKLLYSDDVEGESPDRWYIGDNLMVQPIIRSTGCPICPGNKTASLPWQYRDGKEWNNCSSSVICSIHFVQGI